MTGPIQISIITPCYNGAAFLRATLESVLSQTLRPFEIIVVDDGSTDESAAIAESFGPPVHVIRQPNRGESVARNHGIEKARGTHVLFLDADDLLAPEALERLSAAIAGRSGTLALMGCGWFRDDPSTPYQVRHAEGRPFFPAIIEGNFAPPHCWLTPLELIRRVGGFCEPLRYFEDWDLWWRVALQDPVLVRIDYVGALYRQHAASQLATTKMVDRTRGHAALMDRMARAFLARPDLLEAHGYELFWSCWTALTRARTNGVRWADLTDLGSSLRGIARKGPTAVTQSRLAFALRWFGPRVAMAVNSARSPQPSAA